MPLSHTSTADKYLGRRRRSPNGYSVKQWLDGIYRAKYGETCLLETPDKQEAIDKCWDHKRGEDEKCWKHKQEADRKYFDRVMRNAAAGY